ncbi:uncharacterized protein MKK02DRAFT_43751 [Dioszegia hungarica]|uniref:Uncharacterized protein n=1 Tax=Dioszegia hungarica TaxID=4972 RepID=A0AA38LVB0_9TREE|nr:uncharacterized protein MKK02DRAFT_43751 [Dioszegia hungarica]KAI9635071.1 hypothetical protein MKK02DRAFT_43751 [Dioszegia hungarica]
MDQKHSSGLIASPPPHTAPQPAGPSPRGARIFFTSIALLIVGFIYLIVFVAVPNDRANNLKKQQVADAAIRGPEVFQEMLEEMKSLRKVMERIADKMT